MNSSAQRSAVDLLELEPDLASKCQAFLDNCRKEFVSAVREKRAGANAARHYSRAHDGLLSALFCAADAAVRAAGIEPKGRVSLVAVGAYGRELLGMYSDLDVVFLCDDPSDPFVEALAHALLYPLWDVGADVGHVVRDIEETLRLAQGDIRTATTLLDLRKIAGESTIVEELESRAQQSVFQKGLTEFIDALQADTIARHQRFGGSLYLLEPDVKHGRGGLRDMDVAEWIIRARWGVRSSKEYAECGSLLPREVQELEDSREILWRVRNQLHLRAKRRQDRLTFSDQEEIADALGYVDGISLAVEQFMQEYYRRAQIVAITAERMIERARPRRESKPIEIRKLSDGMIVIDDTIGLEDAERVVKDPALALRFYRQAFRQHKRIDFNTKDVIARISVDPAWRARLQASEEATQIFVSLVSKVEESPFRYGSVVRELHEVGLFVAMIPEFAPLIGKVHHDVYHVYTVDIQALIALDRFRELVRGEVEALGLASRLAAEAPRRKALMLAIVLHSLGKAHGGKRLERGAVLARDVVQRLGLAATDAEHVAWLIEHQDLLYRWATQRDVHDGEAIAEVSKEISTSERLRDLYLLTVCIVSTVNPKAMTSWKARALEDLYLAIASHMDRDHQQRPVEDRVLDVKLQAQVGFVGDVGQEALQAFLDEMPERYFLSNPVDVVRRHARIARDRAQVPTAVTVAPGPSEDLEEFVFMTQDRPGLLADITAVLAANRLDVVAAEIYTRDRPSGAEVFDVFWVRSEGDAPAEQEAEAVERDLIERLNNRVSAADLLDRSSWIPEWAVRYSPDVPTHVHVDNEVSSTFTVVDVFTKDKPGLLSEIAEVLHQLGLNIALAKVNTEGQRVADVFYVSDAKGNKIRDSKRLERLQAVLLQRVQSIVTSDAPPSA